MISCCNARLAVRLLAFRLLGEHVCGLCAASRRCSCAFGHTSRAVFQNPSAPSAIISSGETSSPGSADRDRCNRTSSPKGRSGAALLPNRIDATPHSPQGAERVRIAIADTIDLLAQFPRCGRDTDDDEVAILHLRHASRAAPGCYRPRRQLMCFRNGRLPTTPPTPSPSSSAATREPDDQQQYDRADGGVDDRRNQAGAKVDAQLGK